ncbi:MAG: hypothetical protein E6Q86_08045 [Tolumonas sp.]|nr:MAG: hypothetical protein E6Q86_08045 [Tolumonas sp.]
MRITPQNLTLKSTYDHQQESVRKQEVLPTLAKPDQQDVKVEVRLQSRDALGVSLSRRDLQKAAEQNRLQNKPAISLPTNKTVAAKEQTKEPITGVTESEKTTDDSTDEDLSLDAHTRLMKNVIESLFGVKIRMMPPMKSSSSEAAATSSDPAASQTAASASEPDHQVKVTEYLAEREQLRFSASGSVQTADGKTIDLKLGFAMSYQQLQLSERITRESALKDPLVINLEKQFADLQDTRFEFDIDSDGTKDSLANLSQGSYFLALDKNNNQEIDNGSELFGAQSGNGFAELAQYDEDGNSFIDEGDSIYAKLSVWRPEKGLMAIADVGVGAIYLHPVETQFQNIGNNSGGESQGVLRSSSIYLKEDGTAGTVQQLDLRA